VILRQFLHTEPVVAVSYVVGCGGRAAGAVIDPVAPPDVYVEASERAGIALRYVIDTHVHADHLSTGRELAERTGAAYVLHASAGASFRFQGVEDDSVLELGNVLLRAWHTPGHTPEHITILATDRTRGPEPWLAFTGHTLMVADMGRTELASNAEEGANALFESAERLRTLRNDVLVLPGAFSGSVCGRGLSGTPMSSIGFERRFNRAFQVTDRAAFVALMVRDVPPRPPGAAETRARNLGQAVPVGAGDTPQR
jgi:glyoxylase-like metal-dependent hydrolase (beta-lactamase superfamily II)